jgi:sugar lactone lactonase YvrE
MTVVLALTGCQASGSRPSATATTAPTASSVPLPTCAAALAAYPGGEPVRIGLPAPDDLAFDPQGRLLFSDIKAGTVSRLEPDGSLITLAQGLRNPEGIVVRADGTLLVAEQLRNRVVVVDAQTHTASTWRVFPNLSGREGIDGLGQDRRTRDVIVPDSPNGVVWRLPADGSSQRKIARGMVRPVGADVDFPGNVYVADEGGAVWKLAPTSTAPTRVATLRIPDDVLVDRDGGLIVNTLGDGMVHRIAADGTVTTLLAGLRNPQGIALDGAGNLYVTEFDAGRIDRLVRSFVLGPPVVSWLDATTVTICLPIRRAQGYATPVAVSVADSHDGLQSLLASQLADGGMSAAVAVHVDPQDHSRTITLRVSDGDRALLQSVAIPAT